MSVHSCRTSAKEENANFAQASYSSTVSPGGLIRRLQPKLNGQQLPELARRLDSEAC